jgi:DNA-binding MarR family transcriptional regulator
MREIDSKLEVKIDEDGKKYLSLENVNKLFAEDIGRCLKDLFSLEEIYLYAKTCNDELKNIARDFYKDSICFTKKQQLMAGLIIYHRKLSGISPTVDEIAEEFGVSKATAYEHVYQLEIKGAIKRDKYKARSIMPKRPK